MKNTIKLIGIIALVAVIGFSMAGCEEEDDNGGGGTAPTITTTALTGGTVGTAYSQTLAATGDTPITWSIDTGTLPAGLSLSGNTIVGTPSTAGTSTFTVKATNAAGNDTKALAIVIAPSSGGGTAPTITATLLNGAVGTAYSQTLTATGDAPITWSIESGTLPAGLTLSGNTIAGTPSTTGTSTFTVKETNATGDDTKQFSITIASAGSPVITTPSLPNGTVGTAYSQTLTATGNTPITWSIDTGTLPAGLTLSGNTIAGTPSTAGTSTFTVKATNAAGDDTKQFSITIASAGSPTITTTSLLGGTVGTAYSQTLAATGDTPITWSIDTGTLPAGLTLSGNTIAGTPSTAGTSTFTVKATNAAGNDTKQLSIIIEPAPVLPPTITTTSLPNGTVGTAYSQTLTATGDAPITWSITGQTVSKLFYNNR